MRYKRDKQNVRTHAQTHKRTEAQPGCLMPFAPNRRRH